LKWLTCSLLLLFIYLYINCYAMIDYHLKWLTCSLLLLFIYLYINYYAMIDWSEMREDEIWGKENREENGFFACLVRLERDRKENGAAGVSFQTDPTIFFSFKFEKKMRGKMTWIRQL
jgi:Ca2+/Na+ antiporter